MINGLTELWKKSKIVRIIAVLIISLFFQIFLFEITVLLFPKFNEQPPSIVSEENFDPGLARLNSVSTFIDFCDSLYGSEKIASADSGVYANIVSYVLRYRFFHGYTWYHLGHNYVAKILAPVVHRNLSAIVIPDDILKYPKAACSQQSIIGMKILMEKGYLVRPIGFNDPVIGGHFCYEVKYENTWHFYDPNREPDEQYLNSLNRPGIADLNKNPHFLIKAYPKDNPKYVTDLYTHYKIGKEGKLPGGNARLFQQATQILSYTLWIFIALVYFYIDNRATSKKK